MFKFCNSWFFKEFLESVSWNFNINLFIARKMKVRTSSLNLQLHNLFFIEEIGNELLLWNCIHLHPTMIMIKSVILFKFWIWIFTRQILDMNWLFRGKPRECSELFEKRKTSRGICCFVEATPINKESKPWELSFDTDAYPIG